MIRLQAMSDEEVEAFLPLLIEDYAQDIAGSAAIPIDEARDDADTEFATLLSQGRNTPGYAFDLVLNEESSEPIGCVWWSMNPQKKRGFLITVYVLEAHRGRGFGRAIIKHVDDALRGLGATHIVLNVFARNTVARALYEKDGYAVTNMFMVKQL